MGSLPRGSKYSYIRFSGPEVPIQKAKYIIEEYVDPLGFDLEAVLYGGIPDRGSLLRSRRMFE